MSSSENESSSDVSSHENVFKSNSSNDANSFKNEVEMKSDMESLKKCPSLLTVEELISPHCEAWIVATPSRLDAAKLKNLEFSLSKTTKVNIENEKYEILIQPYAAKNSFLLPDKNAVVKTVEREMLGMISIVQDLKLKASKNNVTNLPAKKGINPPTGLKRRHPLYGDELEDVLAKAKGEKRPKPAQIRDQKKALKKPKQEIIEDNQPIVKGKKKNKHNN